MLLSERVEALTRPDKAIDRDIAKLMDWHRVEPRHTRNKHGAWISPQDWIGKYSDGSPKLDSLHGTTMHRDVPSYTASLDAAMTLYDTLPDTIPSCPRKATAAALRSRGL